MILIENDSQSLKIATMAGPDAGLTLDRLPVGGRARIDAITPGPLKRRLLEMGLCPGVIVTVLRRAPLGDPIELRVRGYLLSVRGEHAHHIRLVAAEG